MAALKVQLYFKMAARIRNSEWEDDIELMNDLKGNVSHNLRQSEKVGFMKVKYSMYCFGIRYTDYSVTIHDVKGAIEKELKGPRLVRCLVAFVSFCL